MSLGRHFVAFDNQLAGTARLYQRPRAVFTAHTAGEVLPALQEAEAARKDGLHLAGWIGYGAVAGVNPALEFVGRDDVLFEIGAFEGYTETLPPELTRRDAEVSLDLAPDWTQQDYARAFARIQQHIRAGDVYQVNLTFPIRGQTDLTAPELYRNLRGRQRGAHGGVASLGAREIISLSPELFVRIESGRATLRPMKGTRARAGSVGADDEAILAEMLADEKSRAENLMIVDLLRNDLSRIAAPGSVEVPELFTSETYETLHQMTSTITGEVSEVSLIQLIMALFPCGSVTGAPKIAAMEIIDALEPTPRGPYCGSMFWMAPDGDAEFNVLIRTLDKQGADVRYSVGSGLVADSDMDEEWEECLLKARVLDAPTPSLIETFRMGPGGYVRLARHMNRLERNARALGWRYDFHALMARLSEVESDPEDQRIRIELWPDNRAEIRVTPLIAKPAPLRVVAGSRPLTPDVQPTAHKTSARAFYDAELARVIAEGADEAVLLNAAGEVCEGTYTSVFVERTNESGQSELLTPPLTAGLLPGILREQLLEEGRAREAVLTWADLLEAETLYMGNSLRGLMIAEIV